jgi:SPP1 gp7 family putative phage head morphogenesis protein
VTPGALGVVHARLAYARTGRRPPKPGPARTRPPAPRLFEAQFRARLDTLVRAWGDHVETLVRAELRTDALDADLAAAWRALVQASGIGPWLKRQAAQTASANAAYVERVANLPVSRAVPRDVLDEFLAENTALITDLPGKQIQRIADIIRPAQQTGGRWEDVAASLEERLGVTRSRAKLIARDQANKFNSVMAEVTQTAAGIEEYEWVTADDYAVRGRPGGEYADSKENHWVLQGKRFRWDSPPLIPGTTERAHPGQRIQCRCTARPVVSDLFAQRPAPPRPAEIVAQESENGYPR